MEMMRGLCQLRFLRRHADADDAWPLWAQVYAESV